MNKRQKKKRIKMKNKKLLKEYPFLLPRNCWSGKVVWNYDYTWTDYDCIPEGWQIGFGKFLLEDLKAACEKTNYTDKLRFTQIKEKFGRLCLYNNGAPQEVYDVINKYEFLSEGVCIKCGSPHARVVDDYGWYLPVCKECWEKDVKSREKDGRKYITYKEAGGEDNAELPTTYTVTTYSKGEDIKTVYDISETVNKINKAYLKRKKMKITEWKWRKMTE